MRHPLSGLVLALVIGLAGCSSSKEAPLVAGGPTSTQAIAAMLENPRIRHRRDIDDLRKNLRLEATGCVRHPNGTVACRVRIYSIGRGWSDAAMGRFINDAGRWVFDF